VGLKVVKSMNSIYNNAMFALSEDKGANQTPDILGFKAPLSVFICGSYRIRQEEGI
jgi:hypothetical protein